MARRIFSVLAFFAAASFLVLVSGQQNQNRRQNPAVPEIDRQCLDCICQGSSDCDTSLKCHNAGNAYFCGPYVISWAYWHDGGRPGDKGGAHDFETCLNNKTCAEQAVRGYMKKRGRDCDKDGEISCYDFARIHKMGPGACGSSSMDETDYWQKFLICYEGSGTNENSFNYENPENQPLPDSYGYDYSVDARQGNPA